MNVTLQAITIDNFEAVMDLELPPEQARYLHSNAYSIAQAHYYPDWRARAIYCDGAPAGFALYDICGDDEPGHYAIYRLMVAHHLQNRGIGRLAMALLLDEMSAQPDMRRVTICYKTDNSTARRFYVSLGFAEIGLSEDGEMVAQLLASPPRCGLI